MNSQTYKEKSLAGSSGTIPVFMPETHPELPIEPRRCEIQLIDSLIRDQTKATIFTTNGYQEHGLIRAHDDKIIVVVGYPGDLPKIMYKRAISTIEQDRNQDIESGPDKFSLVPLPDLSKMTLMSSGLEKFWLDKFIRNHCRVTLITMYGYQEHGFVTAHDDGAVSFIRYETDSSRIIYKTAISTIIMEESKV